MKRLAFILLGIGGGVGCDQLVKNTSAQQSIGETTVLIPKLLGFTHLQNNGAAWSLLAGQQGIFLLITLIALVVASYVMWRKMDQLAYVIGLTLIISGALGNLIDRIRLGYVIDMFQVLFVDFPVFNVADSLLTVGFCILFVKILKEERNETQNKNP